MIIKNLKTNRYHHINNDYNYNYDDNNNNHNELNDKLL